MLRPEARREEEVRWREVETSRSSLASRKREVGSRRSLRGTGGEVESSVPIERGTKVVISSVREERSRERERRKEEMELTSGFLLHPSR